MRNPSVVAVIMGGGRGVRLHPLTKDRCKPAVSIGGSYRLIDIPISNCINSGIHKIFVLTQFNTASLHRHIERTYRFDIFSGGFCAIKSAEQTLASSDWYQGTADAVRQNLRYLPEECDLVLILSGDQLYRMDYDALIRQHREKNADVTIAVQPVDRSTATQMGLMDADDDLRVTEFVEKPKDPAVLDRMAINPEALTKLGFTVDPQKLHLANMGIYLFPAKLLKEMLANPAQIDFGKEVMPSNIAKHRMYAFPFTGFWEDIGTIKAFYDTNMALTGMNPVFNFFDPHAPIYTRPRFLPPTKVEHCEIDHCLISAGGYLENCKLTRCLLSIRSVIRNGAELKDVFMMGADDAEDHASREENRRLGRPDIGIGAGTFIERAIIDKGARIGARVRISSQDGKPDFDGDNYYIRDGITIVPRKGVIPDGVEI